MGALIPDALRDAALVFWDFDGVIKDSVDVKTVAYEKLFLPFGNDVAAKVRKHHEANGGVSRFEKLPQYLEWAGQNTSSATVDEYCDRFADLVTQSVIDSPWVPGAREYIEANHQRQRFILITGTPENEMKSILGAVGIASRFKEVHGAPKTKTVAVRDVLTRLKCDPADAVFVGDAETDLDAATENGIIFLLRRTPVNGNLHVRCATTIDDFTNE
jgi:phosphoglycolate phosphatase-like HAD superfamily hydrolase